jgi:hypothetical protein
MRPGGSRITVEGVHGGHKKIFVTFHCIRLHFSQENVSAGSPNVEWLNTMISELVLILFHIHTDLYTYLQNVYDICMKTTYMQNDYDLCIKTTYMWRRHITKMGIYTPIVMVWFGNVYIFNKVEFPTVLIYVTSEKIRKKAWGSTYVQILHG